MFRLIILSLLCITVHYLYKVYVTVCLQECVSGILTTNVSSCLVDGWELSVILIARIQRALPPTETTPLNSTWPICK